MKKLILVAHTSLDGFVAGPKGELDGFNSGEENLEFVCKLTEEADTALFGRISYKLLDSYWPTARDRPNVTKGEIAYSNWYNTARKIVISRTMTEESLNNTTIISKNIPDEIIKIKEQAGTFSLSRRLVLYLRRTRLHPVQVAIGAIRATVL